MQPLVFEPLFKRIRWGGRRLGTVLGKSIGPESDYAESWEISDHGDDQSVVTSGTYAGRTLTELMQTQNLPLLGSRAGTAAGEEEQFPLLVKFLDANDALSVQVHPHDVLAKQFDPSENGKTEAWVIIDAAPDSRLFVGFQEGVTEADVREAVSDEGLKEGRIESLLHRIEVQAGDCVFVPAGTVHAIGAGVLLAEVQQSSDITFRLYDWNRRGTDGQLRPLHVEKALRCIDFTRGPVEPVVPQRISADHDLKELVRSEYFVIHRHGSDSPFSIPEDKTCHVLMVLEGSGRLCGNETEIPLPLGQTVLLPADRDAMTVKPQGRITLLDAFLPAPGE